MTKFIKHDKGQLCFKSQSIDWGVFSDFSPSENLVEIEFNTGERKWYDIELFFYDYKVKKNSYIGVATGSLVRFYKIIDIEGRILRGKSFLYARLEYTGSNRKLDIEKDYPLKKEFHEMPPIDEYSELPF